jgi:hypothetical protein
MCHNIAKPLLVGLDRVYGERSHQTVHSGQFIILESESTNLCGANSYKARREWSEMHNILHPFCCPMAHLLTSKVGRMGKENCPLA